MPKTTGNLRPFPKSVLVPSPHDEKGLPQSASRCEDEIPARSLLWETALGVRLRKELFEHGMVLVVSEDGVFVFSALERAVEWVFEAQPAMARFDRQPDGPALEHKGA